jgi:hypothetical protein
MSRAVMNLDMASFPKTVLSQRFLCELVCEY